MFNNEEFVPESFGYIYQYECTETIARISDPGVNLYNVEMVQKEAERNLNWVRKMLPSFEFKEEKDNYEFFYTCALLYFTYRAISFKKDVSAELSELKGYIQDAIKRCRAFPDFDGRVCYTEKKTDGRTSCDEDWGFCIKNFWNWKYKISDYDCIFHVNPNSSFQMECKKEYPSLYEKGTCSEETFGFNLYVMMVFAAFWPQSHSSRVSYFCHWASSSCSTEDYEINLNNFLLNWFYAYCETPYDSKGNLYNFYARYQFFNDTNNRVGYSCSAEGYDREFFENAFYNHYILKKKKSEDESSDDLDMEFSDFPSDTTSLRNKRWPGGDPRNDRRNARSSRSEKFCFLFNTIESYKEVCTWAVYDSLFKDNTNGLERLVNIVFGELFPSDKRQWYSQILRDIRKEYYWRYSRNPGIIMCLYYLLRSMELSDIERIFYTGEKEKYSEKKTASFEEEIIKFLQSKYYSHYGKELEDGWAYVKKMEEAQNNLVQSSSQGEDSEEEKKYFGGHILYELVFSKQGEEEKKIFAEDFQLLNMFLYFAFWENLSLYEGYLAPCKIIETNLSVSDYAKKSFYRNFVKKQFKGYSFDYQAELKKNLNVISCFLNFNRKNAFSSLDFSQKTPAIRIIYALSTFYNNPKDSIINLMTYVHELQMQNYSLHVDTSTEFSDENKAIEVTKKWEKNFDHLKKSDFGFLIPRLYQTFEPFDRLFVKDTVFESVNVPGLYGESHVKVEESQKLSFPIFSRSITCKLMCETDKKVEVSIPNSGKQGPYRIFRNEDFSVGYANNIQNHYMYDDRSMSVHERVLKSIKIMTEENKVKQLLAFFYSIKEELDSELKKMGYDEKALEKDFSSGDFSKSPAGRKLLFYLDWNGGQPCAWTSIGPLLLRKKLEYFATKIVKKIRPNAKFSNVWKECIGSQGKVNLCKEELRGFSLELTFGQKFIEELQDFLSIICTTQGLVKSVGMDFYESDFLSCYSTEILLYLSCLAFEFQK